MRPALWILMWSAIGMVAGIPIVMLIEHFAGTPPELLNVWIGAATVWAGWGVGVLIYDRWDWPHWLSQ